MKQLSSLDLFSFSFPGDPQLAPDGSRLAYVNQVVDRQENRYRSRIWMVDLDGQKPGKPRPFSAGVGSDHSPRFSPSGTMLAFLSDRPSQEDQDQKNTQLYVIPVAGGEARALTSIKGGLSNISWSPDGRFLAFTARIRPGEDLQPVEADKPPASRLEQRAPWTSGYDNELKELYQKFNEDVRLIDSIPYKADGSGFLNGTYSQVFVLDVQAALDGDAEPQQVTSGAYNHLQPAWSPDSSEIAVSACRAPRAGFQDFSDVWVFPLPGTSEVEPRKLTPSQGPAFNPVWSPDGQQIAFFGHRNEESWYSNQKLWLVPAGGGEPRLVCEEFDRNFGDSSITDIRAQASSNPCWSEDGASFFTPVSYNGTTQLCRIDLAAGQVHGLTSGDQVIYASSILPEKQLAAVAVARSETNGEIELAYLGEDQGQVFESVAGTEPHFTSWQQAKQVKVSSHNDWLAGIQLSIPERFTVKPENSPALDAWVMTPPDHDGQAKLPVVLQIHGGPMAMYTSTLFMEFQLLAARGYAVVYCNPRGSMGYGEAFCAAIQDEWGDKDSSNIMDALDAALERFDFLDSERVGVAGGSYGGYMSSWLIGHTDRFGAAVVMRPLTSANSFFGTSDIGHRWDKRFRGYPWTNPSYYAQQSPLSYAHEVTTPTLLIHSEQDYRCPIEQSEQYFTVLQTQEVESEFARYPGESHGLSRGGQPWHRVDRLERIVAWFDEYL